jgi:hypothetical protein
MIDTPSSSEEGSAEPDLCSRMKTLRFLNELLIYKQQLDDPRVAQALPAADGAVSDFPAARLDEIELLARMGRYEDWERIESQHADFLRTLEAVLPPPRAKPMQSSGPPPSQDFGPVSENKFHLSLDALDADQLSLPLDDIATAAPPHVTPPL